MTTVTIMCGLPASGKSTYAKKLSKENDSTVLSSDALRQELYNDIDHQDNNGELFQELYQRAKILLNKGQNVIVDATNISSKRRTHFINEFKQFNKKCVYMATPHKTCVREDRNRERNVGKFVIDRMYKQMNIPFKEEGWDEVDYIFPSNDFRSRPDGFLETLVRGETTYGSLFEELNYETEFRQIYELPHDSSYHSLSVSRHTYYVWEYIRENYRGIDDMVMLWTALLHDIGKAFCKEFREGKRTASFIGHENVSAQLAADVLYELGYDAGFIIQVAKLVQLHMRLLNGGDKAEEKIRAMYGTDTLDRLKLFREADTQAH